MLSLGYVSIGMLADYYSQDDYYFSSSKGVLITGREIFGKDVLQLSDVHDLLKRRGDLKENTRVADDLTFSAPKSFSILASLNSKDERDELLAAHQSAVNRTVEFLRDFGFVKTRDDRGKPAEINKNSVVSIRFDHFLNRNQDPQVHSHVLLINSVERASDGKFRAAYLRDVYLHKKEIGALYRQELAKNLEKLGYRVEWDNRGFFEIKGFTKEQLKGFSTRRAEIEEALRERKLEGGKAAAVAAKDTRKVKESVDPVQLSVKWKEKALDLGITLPDREKGIHSEKNLRPLVKSVVREEIYKNGFTSEKDLILKSAERLSQHRQTANIGEIREEVEKAIEEESRLHGGMLKDGDKLTFKNVSYAAEFVKRDSEKSPVSLEVSKEVERVSQQFKSDRGVGLSREQQEAVVKIFRSDRDVVVIGKAGAGKTTTFLAVKEVADEKGVNVIGIAYTGAAAKNLEKETGIKSYTVDSLALRKIDVQNGIMIVDEASLLDNTRASAIKQIAKENNAKVVYVGDERQLKGVGVGTPFSVEVQKAEKNGSLTCLTEIFRQKDAYYKEAVIKASVGNTQEAIEMLEKKGWLKETTKNEAIKEITEKYLRDVRNEKDSLVLADRNKDVERLNKEIHYRLKREGVVKDERVFVLRNSRSQPVEREIGVGERILFLRNDSRLDVKNGEIGFVRGIEENKIKVEMKGGDIKTIDLSEYKHITYGYAMTTHKSQGQTVDNVYYLASNRTTQEAFYVAISRGRENVSVFSKDVESLKDLMRSESSKEIKMSVSEKELREFDAVSDLRNSLLGEIEKEEVLEREINDDMEEEVLDREVEYERER